jgi:ribosomal protein S1
MNKEKGDEVDVLIEQVSSKPYYFKGSFVALSKKYEHNTIMKNANTEIYKGKVIDIIGGGYTVEITLNGQLVKCFMPNILAGINRIVEPTSIVGKEFEVMIDNEQKEEEFTTYIVSRKKYLHTLIPKVIEKIKTVDENNYPIAYKGIVTGKTQFGIFVEFMGCLTGMIHFAGLHQDTISELPTIKPGDSINFFIKEIAGTKLILTQIWKETIWDIIAPKMIFKNCKVKGVAKIGMLIELDSETQGLIHTSELDKMSNKLEVGELVNVTVLAVDRISRKIFLQPQNNKNRK